MIPNSFIVALERVQFQVGSPLSRRLIALFEEAVTFVKDTQPVDEHGNIEPVGQRRAQFVQRYLVGKWAQQMIAVLKEELGLNLVLLITPRTTPDAFAYLHYGPRRTLNEAQNKAHSRLLNGGGSPEDAALAITDTVTLLAGRSDPNTGRLDAVASNFAVAYLGLSVGLLLTAERYHGMRALTAGELAAIFLHEIGHIILRLHDGADTTQRAQLIRDTVQYATSQMRKDRDAALVAKINQLIEQLPKGADKEKLKKAAGALNAGDDEVRRLAGGFVLTAYFTIKITAELYRDAARVINQPLEAGQKTSDQLTTRNATTREERGADEFVARHGLSGELASATALYHQSEFSQLRSYGRLSQLAQNSDSFARLLSGFLAIKSVFYNAHISMVTNYDPFIERLERMIQNNMAYFKDPDLPAELRQAMIEDTEKAKAVLAEYRSQANAKAREFIWKTMFRLAQNASLTGALMDGNLRSDYAKLQDMMADLIRSPLYYHAARIKALASRAAGE